VQISIIIPAYNAARTLEECINSCLTQETDPSVQIEILVIDDCSTDETAQILRDNFSDEITVITHTENRGLSAARNSGLRQSAGSVLFFLDADMIAEPAFVRSHLEYYESDPEICGIVNEFVPGKDVPDNKFTRYLYHEKRGASQAGEGGGVPPHHFLFSGTSIRRAIYETAGGFDERISNYGGEDTEYAYRLSRQIECNFIYSEKTVLHHNHYRTLENTCSLLYQYGKETLPHLVETYPELKPHVGLSAPNHVFIPKVLRLLAAFPFTVILARGCFNMLPAPLSHGFVKILLGVSLLRGYFQSDDN